MYSDDVIACAKLVERGDPLRFRAVMASPAALRPALFTLFAFNVEVARAPWITKEAMIADMRLVDFKVRITQGGDPPCLFHNP